ncbi:hypothetical protein C9I86_19490 [Photobacterium sp. NCIMB 13483]|nr:hypothetical protein C9I86_19490 [Photobacterium sp. NCIMB 13483]
MGYDVDKSDLIEIHYDGEGEDIKAHLMSATLVSSSVKAFDVLYKEAFYEANKIFKSKYKTNTYIQGGFDEGSLKWLQKIISNQKEEQINIDDCSCKSKITAAVSNALSILLKIDENMPEIKIKESSEGYSVHINERECEPTDPLVCALLTNKKASKAISQLVNPLSIDGIDTLTISDFNNAENTNSVIEIKKSEIKRFTRKSTNFSIVEDGEFTGFYKVEDLSYNPQKAWKFISINKPSDNFTGIITDEYFWSEVSSNKQRFGCEDVMDLVVFWKKERKSLTSKARTSYIVKSVKHYDRGNEIQCTMP